MPKEPLMDDEFQRIIDSCENEFEKQTILILRYTGMHISVLCVADKSYIKGNYLKWYRPKTSKLVRIPIHPLIKPFIKEYLDSDRFRYRQYYNNLIKKIGGKAGIKGLSPMNFRHTFGVWLKDEGYEVPEIKTMMGVENLKVITRYTIYSDKQLEEKWKRTGWLE